MQRAKNQVDLNIQLFKEMKNKVEEDFNSTDEAERRKKHRLLQKMKLEKLRHVFEGRGRMLKCEEFPDLAAVLEFAFGESDRIERGGGGLESHPRLTDTVLYRAADSNTIMKHTRETILYLSKSESSSEVEMESENKVNANMEAIRLNGTYVLVLWSKQELGNTGWKTGKYKSL